MKDGTPAYPIHFDARLVEEAVVLAEGCLHPLLRLRFRRERDRIYDVEATEAREEEFVRLHHRWFTRLRMDGPLERSLRERPDLRESTRRCLVVPAGRAEEEDADLRDEDGPASRARPSIVIRVRPKTLADGVRFERFLDHELLHLTDMLDPGFGYRREAPALAGGSARRRHFQERYRVLWDCTIDGRLHLRGRLGVGGIDRRRREFATWFPEFDDDRDREFRRWFAESKPTHEGIVRTASLEAGSEAAGVCPLCRFPYGILPRLHDGLLDSGVLSAIRSDFASWRPDHGACTPCIELYRARLRALAGMSPKNDRVEGSGSGTEETGRTGKLVPHNADDASTKAS